MILLRGEEDLRDTDEKYKDNEDKTQEARHTISDRAKEQMKVAPSVSISAVHGEGALLELVISLSVTPCLQPDVIEQEASCH